MTPLLRRKKKVRRAVSIMRAIDTSSPGDSVVVHDLECFGVSQCICQPRRLYIDRRPTHPLGFRPR